jgi:UPF0755 protein
MDENKTTPQNMTPEEELDLLLEQFLAEEDPITEDASTITAEELLQVAEAEDAQKPDEEEELTIWQGPSREAEQEAAISDEALWENIDVEDPAAALDSKDGEPAPAIAEIGPDEEALAGIVLTHPADAEELWEEGQEPDWVLEPTAIIPELPRTERHSIDLPDEIFQHDGSEEDDPLRDPALRTLLFDETAAFKDEEFRDTFGEVEEIYSSAPAKESHPQEDAAVEEPAPEPEEPVQEAAPMRKKRPRNKHSYGLLSIPHIMTTIIWLVLVVAIGASLGRMLWMCAADVLAFGRPDQTVYVTITKNDTLDSVAEKLHRAGLINYPGLFKLYGKLSNIMDDLSIGTYELNTMYDYHALSTSMSEKPAMRVTVDVTIPEGYTCAQIFALLEQKEVCTVAELEEYASTSKFADYWFLEGTERGSKYCLEGFLFPDTYEFYVDSDPKEVYIKLLAAFDYRFTAPMKEKLAKLNETLNAKMKKNGLDQSYIDSHQITIREVIIIASLIEKETSGIEDDRYNISSVIYNRLTNPGKFPYLNIDAALIYVTGDNVLTDEDLAFDSPYNTYLYQGLIPGPISNPGRASLDAALDPTNTSYYYYVLDPATGTHDYSKTYEEHMKKVEKYKESLGG